MTQVPISPITASHRRRPCGHVFSPHPSRSAGCWPRVWWERWRWWRLTLASRWDTCPARWRRNWAAGHCWTLGSTVCSLPAWSTRARSPSPSRPPGSAWTQVAEASVAKVAWGLGCWAGLPERARDSRFMVHWPFSSGKGKNCLLTYAEYGFTFKSLHTYLI